MESIIFCRGLHTANCSEPLQSSKFAQKESAHSLLKMGGKKCMVKQKNNNFFSKHNVNFRNIMCKKI